VTTTIFHNMTTHQLHHYYHSYGRSFSVSSAATTTTIHVGAKQLLPTSTDHPAANNVIDHNLTNAKTINVSSDNSNDDQKNEKKKKTFGSMMRTYGPVFLGTYIAVYLTTLSSLYAGVTSGILDPVALFSTLGITTTTTTTMMADGSSAVDVATSSTTAVELVHHFLCKYDLTRSYAHYVPSYPGVANFGVAWIAAKFTEPFRIPIAIAITPRIARFWNYHRRHPLADEKDVVNMGPAAVPAPGHVVVVKD
jgi:hypothetical protein